MARTIGHGRTIEQKQPVPKYKLPPEAAPEELTFFKPPKGIDVVSDLTSLPREYSPAIVNLFLDRGVMRSRNGIETYHNGDGGILQHTVDIIGSASQSIPDIQARTTANQGGSFGWTDPDGTVDGQNIVTTGLGFSTVDAANRLYNIVGDPTQGANIDAYDDAYVVTFTILLDTTNVVGHGSPWSASANVQIEYSVDGGTNWTLLPTVYSVSRSTQGTSSQAFSPSVIVSGSPSSLRFRLVLQGAFIPSGSPVPTGTITATVSVKPAAYNPVTWTTSTSLPISDRIPMRWTQSHLQTYDDPTDVAAAWTTVYSFPASQLNNDNLLPTFVTFGDQIISTDIGNIAQTGAGSRIGSQGLITTALATGHATTVLPKSPRAAHLAVFGDRIVASRTNDWTSTTDPWVESTTRQSRIRWSVKNDATDWIGIGSGFEDFLVPAGSTDEVMGVYPVSDETAIVVSEHTIRRLDVTGFVDAPFRPGLLTDEVGTLSRYTIRSIPSGVIFLGYDDVYVVTLGDIKRIATKAMRDSIAAMTSPRLATGYVDKYNGRFLLAFKEGGTQVIWVYSFIDGGWTRYALPFDVVFIDLAFIKLGGGARYYGTYYTMAVAGGFSCRDNPSRSQDVDTSGADVDSGMEARTGFLIVDPLRKIELIEAQLLYESLTGQTLLFEYSVDGGQTWSIYSTKDITATTRPTVLSVRQTLEREALQLRVRSLQLGKLKVISFHAFATPGGMIKP